MHLDHHGQLSDMVETYGKHGADNLSLWLTNAREAAAKITAVTRARQREKEEKYGKFLRDLQSRVAVSSKEKNLSKIPQARPYRHQHGHIDNDSNLERSKPMDKIRVYLEKELHRPSECGHGISKLHRECMMQALLRDKVIEPLAEKACNIHHNLGEDNSAGAKKTGCTLPNLLTTPFVVPLSLTTTAQMPNAMTSEPCTPTGWNTIPTSFSALEMRSLERDASPTPPETRETGHLNVKSCRVSSPKEKSKHLQGGHRGIRVPRRSQSSLSRFSRGGQNETKGKENMRLNTCFGDSTVHEGNTQVYLKEMLANAPSVDCEQQHKQCGVSVSNEGVTTCPMGVVVLKGREEYEIRGQGKQFFSDVWKCAMEMERRCAHERAHSLHVLKKKRLEQQKAERRYKAELMREKSVAKQREAVQMQLKSVAAWKARREGIVQRHRAVEKKRFSHALQAVRMERMQGYGVQVPPLCDCGHGVHPLNSHYIKKCHIDCPLRNNFPEYALQLENRLQQLLDDFNATYYPEHALHWLSTQYPYGSCC